MKPRQPRAVLARLSFQLLREPALGRRAARHKKMEPPMDRDKLEAELEELMRCVAL